ncbi:hypothetical protein GUJ93_ZPchr0006g42983 [Zizania palustris]|uniref:Uncharacterized protein n=1 Tax=Zizania palustris TaxID=103762 RepID=A0A8J5SHD2_ZIZPA|nr:hypothetical protein GUJ93_ZPchr0006g42983 [Zizania palustris]
MRWPPPTCTVRSTMGYGRVVRALTLDAPRRACWLLRSAACADHRGAELSASAEQQLRLIFLSPLPQPTVLHANAENEKDTYT